VDCEAACQARPLASPSGETALSPLNRAIEPNHGLIRPPKRAKAQRMARNRGDYTGIRHDPSSDARFLR
jgi:hypothetical protein